MATLHPSGIPSAVKRDRALIRLMQVRSNKLTRYAYISKRVKGTYNAKRALKEKAHTRERKILADEIRDIERTLMQWLGEHTRHPDLYTPSPAEKPLQILRDAEGHPIRHPRTKQPLTEAISTIECTYHRYKRRWRMNRGRVGKPVGNISASTINVRRTKARHVLAKQIMDMEWQWLSALHERIFKDAPLPPRRVVSPDRYHP